MSDPTVDVQAVRDALTGALRSHGGLRALAERCGMSERAVRRALGERDRLDVWRADELLTAAGAQPQTVDGMLWRGQGRWAAHSPDVLTFDDDWEVLGG